MFLHADSENSDQTGRMPRLIWVSLGAHANFLVLSCRGSLYLYLHMSLPPGVMNGLWFLIVNLLGHFRQNSIERCFQIKHEIFASKCWIQIGNMKEIRYNFSQNDEDCAALYGLVNYQWVDIGCDWDLYYICKKPMVSIWAVTWQNQQSDCAPSEDSDQPGHSEGS